jgi:hypothetical protein
MNYDIYIVYYIFKIYRIKDLNLEERPSGKHSYFALRRSRVQIQARRLTFSCLPSVSGANAGIVS